MIEHLHDEITKIIFMSIEKIHSRKKVKFLIFNLNSFFIFLKSQVRQSHSSNTK